MLRLTLILTFEFKSILDLCLNYGLVLNLLQKDLHDICVVLKINFGLKLSLKLSDEVYA